jgi:transcriptional regulator of arginine metabolism
MTMRESGEHKVDPVEIAVEPPENSVCVGGCEIWVDRGDRLTRFALPEQLRGREQRVRDKKAQKFAADIARGSENGCPNHWEARLLAYLHKYARLCIDMHMNADLKERRRRAIADLIRANALASQEELAERLAALGYGVTQATISRDLEQIGAVKVRREGQLSYALPQQRVAATPSLESVLSQWAGSIEVAMNLVVIKTPPGSAHLIGVALDQADIPAIVGTICGDDTIFVACRTGADAQALASGFRSATGLGLQ